MPLNIAFITGSSLGMASMFSIGPINLMLIKEGLTSGRIVIVPTIVASFYVTLITISCSFSDAITNCSSAMRTTISWFGVFAILYFAQISFASGTKSIQKKTIIDIEREKLCNCVKRVVVVLALNPLLYIELIIVPATICASFDGTEKRVAFVAGLSLVSVFYCFLFSLSARLCSPLITSDSRLRIIDISSGIILTTLAGVTAYQLAWR